MSRRTKPYSAKFKAKMIQKMSGPTPVPASRLAAQVGVSQSALSRWLREAPTVGSMKKPPQPDPSRPEPKPLTRPEDWTPEAKLRFVSKALDTSDEELGRLLRQEGVHEAQLEVWKKTILTSLLAEPQRKTARKSRRERQLERELKRKNKALAETAALLVLRGKLDALWGEEGEST